MLSRSRFTYPPWLVFWAALAGLFVWVFSDVLFHERNFAYRDAAHFYHPLFQFVDGQWSAGAPLWNPYENAGAPLAGMGTSCVFYPGKLLFALPLSFDARFKVYVLAHLLLAAASAYWLARRWHRSVEASAMCALSYAFCGNVLFQYANVVFLTGAAWLPLAVWHMDHMIAERRLSSALMFGLVLALMTTGGDPQMAYHAGLMAAGLAWLSWRYERRQRRRGAGRWEREDVEERRPLLGRLAGHRLVLLAVAAVSGLMFAAVQVLPSWELARHSARSVYEAPRNLYELAGSDAEGPSYDGLLAKADANTHAAQLYQFSVGPWRLAEYVWPNVGGRQFPRNQGWFSMLPAEERLWTPSLYMGLLPLVLAVGGWRIRRADVRFGWLSWVALLCLLASLGRFGLGRLWREAAVLWNPQAEDPSAWPVGDAFGGIYWFMTVTLPGYVNFRYPAKLLVPAAFAMSMLAARGWDKLSDPGGRWVSRSLLAILAMTLAAAVAVPFLTGKFAGKDSNLFGPFLADQARNDLFAALLQTAAVGLAAWLLVRRVQASGSTRWAAVLAIGLVSLDLALANRWMVATAPAKLWTDPSKLAEVIADDAKADEARDDAAAGLYRVDRPFYWYAPAWKSEASPARLEDAVAWEHDTLYPKHHLQYRLHVVRAFGTLSIYDYEVFLSHLGRANGIGRRPAHPRGLDAINVRYLLLPPGAKPPGHWRRLEAPELEDLGTIQLWKNPHALPRAWIVHQIHVLPTLRNRSPAAIERRTLDVLFPGGKPRDFRRTAAVETDDELPSELVTESDDPPAANAASSQADESCRIVSYAAQQIEIEVELAAPGLVVLSDMYFPGWEAEVRTEGTELAAPATIHRTNRMMRGIPLPAGTHRLTLHYRPASEVAGVSLSLFGLFMLPVVWVLRRWQRRKSPDQEPEDDLLFLG